MKSMKPSPSKSRLNLITGPSGVGKGSVVKELLKRNPIIWLSVSLTTRSPREGEIEGIHYYFVDHSRFQKLISKDGLLEWAQFAGNFYGTPSKPIQQKLSDGRVVLMEIELEGARQVRQSYPEAFQLFLAPPSFNELEKRIRGRGTDTEEAIQKRLSRAKEELNAQKEFDVIVINEDIDRAVLEIEKILNL